MRYKDDIKKHFESNDFSFFKEIIDDFFSDYISLNMSFSFLDTSHIIYRTRPYLKPDVNERYEDKTLLFQGYNREESGASPQPGNNRFSDEKVRCFYGSLNMEVSIYEVYSPKYSFYSVAYSAAKEELKMIDFSSNRLFYVKEPYNKSIVDKFTNFIDLLNDLDRPYYRFSQKVSAYLMDKFRIINVDGLMYDSFKSKKNDINIAIFSIDKIDITETKLKKIEADFTLDNMKEILK